MMAAIGIILISKQIPLALGYNQPDFWRVVLYRFLPQKFSWKYCNLILILPEERFLFLLSL
jgi:MFS superfamily sulfate permease-like transporter